MLELQRTSSDLHKSIYKKEQARTSFSSRSSGILKKHLLRLLPRVHQDLTSHKAIYKRQFYEANIFRKGHVPSSIHEPCKKFRFTSLSSVSIEPDWFCHTYREAALFFWFGLNSNIDEEPPLHLASPVDAACNKVLFSFLFQVKKLSHE